MDDYLRVVLRSKLNEAEGAFKARLAEFWTHMLRTRPDDYEKVYAEATKYEPHGVMLTRQYLIENAVLDVLLAELQAAGFDHEPVDADDLYSKYEAAPPDWFWLEH